MSSILTVSQLNRYISFKLKEDIKLRGILVRGEISGFTNHYKTGHFYFTLKDKDAAVKAVMFNSFASRLKFMPENGMSVTVSGSVQVFERDGVYQLYVTDIQPDGAGALYVAFEQLKDKLMKEGLFDEAHKKQLPAYPKKIGIVTSFGAAALQDMLNIISRRYPIAEVTVFGAAVQGDTAPDSVSTALKYADCCGLDLIIVGRGGGSAEDLFCFNSEKIARAVYECETPVISAVGHETDTTITDFVSDLRAPTPSAAAELAVPDISVMRAALEGYKGKLSEAFSGYIDRLYNETDKRLRTLSAHSPYAVLEKNEKILSLTEKRLAAASERCFGGYENRLARAAERLELVSPLKIMSKGYAIVYSENGKMIKSSADAGCGRIKIRFSDGFVDAEIIDNNK
ncbi:MAG: exodeoxyribonuclease VII large subunit [Ruminococcus sp.]|nr:exodeoxyribonuclease VII large subunit [Ruminococcus sp.]